ncbi:hypothetical protein ACJX0J_021702, partial [Zea mays]
KKSGNGTKTGVEQCDMQSLKFGYTEKFELSFIVTMYFNFLQAQFKIKEEVLKTITLLLLATHFINSIESDVELALNLFWSMFLVSL